MIKFRLFVFHKNISTIQNVVHDGEDVLGCRGFPAARQRILLDGCQNIRKYRKIPS